MKLIALVLLLPTLALAHLPPPGHPSAPKDPRYCGEPARDANGRIVRGQKVLRDFARVFPCPATMKPTTSCKGWAIDHVLPLASGGCDSQVNLQWLPDVLKSCAGTCKDRWERKYHATPRQRVTLPPTDKP